MSAIIFIYLHVLKVKRSALWVKFSADDILKYLFLFFPGRKQVLTFHLNMSPVGTVCTKCQIMFSGEKIKIYIFLIFLGKQILTFPFKLYGDNLHEMSNPV